jgi:predicted kinase
VFLYLGKVELWLGKASCIRVIRQTAIKRYVKHFHHQNFNTIVLMVGNVGAGKTTLSNKLKDVNTEYISIDELGEEFENKYGSDKYIVPWNREIIKLVVESIEKKCNIIIDGNLITKRSRNIVRQLAQGAGYKAICCDFGPGTAKQLQRRIKDSPVRSPHDWTQVFEQKKDSYQIPTLEEGFDKIIKIN